jgi:predicted XRE-type DNA-binding protein
MPSTSRTAKKGTRRPARPRAAGGGEAVTTVGVDDNIFEALGLPQADEWLAKAELARAIAFLIKRRELTQTAAAKLLGVAQSDVSNLARGRLVGYSMDRLYRFLKALGQDVDIVVRPKPRSRKTATVRALVHGEAKQTA